MLPADAQILGETSSTPISQIREEEIIAGASGWGETSLTKATDVFVNFDQQATLIRLTTSGGAILRCTPDQLCFGRLNPVLHHYSLYLHERSTLGFRLSTTNDLMRDIIAMNNLKTNLSDQDEVIDRIWIVETTPNLNNAIYMEKYAAFKYGLPNIPFSSRQNDSELSEEMTRELFNSIDTPSRAHQLLRDWNMYINSPHITLRLSNRNAPISNAIQFIIFGSNERGENDRFSHLIQIDGALETSRAEHKTFKRRQGKHGLWYLEITRSDLEEAELFVKTLSHLDSLEVVKKIQLTRKSPFYILPASHIKPGMLVPIIGRKGTVIEDRVTTVETENYKGPLYNVQVKNLHNFISGQWVLMCYAQAKSLIG